MNALTDIIVGPADLYIDGQNVGWTRGGVRMRLNRSLWSRPSLYGLGNKEVVKQSEEFYISTILSESTLQNLKRAWAIYEPITNPNDSSSYTRIDFGGSVSIPTHTLKFIARNRTLQVVFYKVIAVDYGEIQYSPKQEASIPATFKALLDETKTIGAQIGYIQQGPYVFQSDLSLRVSVPKIKRRQLYLRSTIRRKSTRAFLVQLTVPKIKRKQIYARLITFKRSYTGLIIRLTSRVKTGKSLVCQTTVYYTPSTFKLNSRVVTLKKTYKNMFSRVTSLVLHKPLFTRVTIIYGAGTLNLVSRVTTLKKSSTNLVSSVTKVAA